MFRRGSASTEVDRKPFFFTLTAFAVGAASTALLIVFGGGNGLAVFAAILLGIVTLAAGAVLFGMVTDRAYVEDGVLHMRYLFKHAAVRLEEIGKLTLKDDTYTVYDRRGNEVGTINGKLTGVSSVLFELDRNGARVE